MDEDNTIKYEFIVKMLEKYFQHLISVEQSIGRNIAFYNKSIEELERLIAAGIKVKEYTNQLKKQQAKVYEADKKLSYIIPNMNLMTIQILLLKKKHNID